MSAADRRVRLEGWCGGGAAILGDGAWGTELRALGLGEGAWADSWNLRYPARVEALARQYRAAGAAWLLTNTFGANALNSARFGHAYKAEELAEAGARISRKAAGEEIIVLGSMGPAEDPARPAGRAAVYDAFAGQAAALMAGGCDGILVETMGQPEETSLAVAAARAGGAAVVWCSFAFRPLEQDGIWRSYGGVPLEELVAAAQEAGARGIGANCMIDGAAMIPLMTALAEASGGMPLLARPCAQHGATRLAPATFAAQLAALAQVGVRLLGGCCGAGPAHIAAAKALL